MNDDEESPCKSPINRNFSRSEKELDCLFDAGKIKKISLRRMF